MIYYIVSDSGNNEWIVYQPFLWIIVPNFKLIFCNNIFFFFFLYCYHIMEKVTKSLWKMSPRKDNSVMFYS